MISGPTPTGSPMVRARMGLKVDWVIYFIPWRRQALHLNVDLIPPEGDLEVVIKEVGGVGAVEGRPGPGSDGIGNAVPVAGKVAVDMTGKDMGHVILTKQGGQPAPGGLRQAVVIVTPPGVKEGSMEKHQAGLVRLGFFQFAFQPAPLDLADPARLHVIDHDEVVALDRKGIVIGPEDLPVEGQVLVLSQIVIAHHRQKRADGRPTGSV